MFRTSGMAVNCRSCRGIELLTLRHVHLIRAPTAAPLASRNAAKARGIREAARQGVTLRAAGKPIAYVAIAGADADLQNEPAVPVAGTL